MSLNLQQKEAVVAEVSAEVAQAQAIVLAEYRGLAVGALTDLRKKARGAGVYFRVIKNTLVRRAVATTPFAGLSDQMVGPLAYGISSDPVKIAKVLHEFARSNDKFVIKAGAMANFVMSAKEVASLATMPSRDELLAKLMATMQAPIATFVRTLNEVPSRFARTLAAVCDQKNRLLESSILTGDPIMALAKAEVLEAISNMTVLELSSLIKDMEEKFGVSAAAAAVAVAAPAAGAAAAPAEEQTELSIVLTNAGQAKVNVIKVVRSVTGLGLKEAKDLVDAAPKAIKEGVARADAETILKQLVDAGAQAEIK